MTPARGVTLKPQVGPFTTFNTEIPGRYRVRVHEGKLAAAVVLRVVPNTAPKDLATLKLILVHPRLGSRLDTLLGVPAIPKGMPPALPPTSVSVPLQPGARAIQADPHSYPGPIPVSWYLAASSVHAFYLPAAQDRVLNWYNRAFSALGYDRTGSSVDPGRRAIGYSYVPTSNPNELTVSVLTRPAGAGTDVLYGATWIRMPPRPPASLWTLARVPRLVVTYHPATGPIRRWVVTQTAWRRKLVDEVNAMTLEAGLPISCPMMMPAHRVTATLSTAHYPTVHLFNTCGVTSRMGGLLLAGGSRALTLIRTLAAAPKAASAAASRRASHWGPRALAAIAETLARGAHDGLPTSAVYLT